MSTKYNHFAKDLDAAFKAARDEYVEAYQRFQQAQQANCRANAWTPNESAAEKQVKTARAALALHDAEAAFTEASARVWGDFKTTRRMLRADLEREVRAANLANPDAIDNNALELLKSGVLTSDDYAAFMEKYDSNPTMLKLLARYAAEAAKATDSRREAATLNAISIDCQSGQGAILRAFDDLCKVSDYCRGERHDGDRFRPEYTAIMSEKWDDLAGEAVESF